MIDCKIKWENVLNHSITIRDIKERRAFENLLNNNDFNTVQEIINADDTGTTTLSVLKSLVDEKMAFYVKLNNKYWFRMSPLGALYDTKSNKGDD